MEKALNALLIDKHIETKTHTGAMKMFNVEYVRVENAFFSNLQALSFLRTKQYRQRLHRSRQFLLKRGIRRNLIEN